MEDLDKFSSETLNEMEMQSLVGGNIPPPPPVNNCNGGYCSPGCGIH